MNRLLLAVALMFAVLFSSAYSQRQPIPQSGTTTTPEKQGRQSIPPTPAPEKKKTTEKTTSSKNMMKGKVMSLAGYVSGKMTDGSFKDNDQPLVLVTGQGKSSKIYFIYNSDGTYAGKKLMAFTPNKMVSVSGKTKTVNGLNVIYADAIQSAE